MSTCTNKLNPFFGRQDSLERLLLLALRFFFFAFIALMFAIEVPADHPSVNVNTDPQYVSKLIKQLGHPRYVLREQAQTELIKIGPQVLDALSAALLSDDIEIAMRARYLLTAIKIQWVNDGDPKHIHATMKDYDQKSDTQRKGIIEELSKQAKEPELATLGRIVRYEKSTPLSKLAALAVLENAMDQKSPEAKQALIIQQLQHSQRPAAQWVLESFSTDSQMNLLIDRWKKIVASEQAAWKKSGDQTNYEIVQKTLFYLVKLLDKADRKDEAELYLTQIVELQPKDEQSVRILVQKMLEERTDRQTLEKRAARVIENLGEKFKDLFSTDPLLLYVLAHAKRTLGNSAAADEIAMEARKLNPTTAANHLDAAYKLERQGWFDWSEDEYQKVIQIDGLKSIYTHLAISQLSEMLHDQGHDKKAAAALEPLVLLLKTSPKLKKQLVTQLNRRPSSLYSRMHFFRACHHKSEGDRDKQQAELLQAIGEDPSDADVLIALYRMPNQTDEETLQTKKRIDSAIDSFRKRIQTTRNSATALNQFAWLVGNTYGEVNQQLAEEAIRNSHKSLEKKPDAAGYFDTLGRCYYAKGDIENALRFQKKAARLNPHSGLIRGQLELFEQTRSQNEQKSASS